MKKLAFAALASLTMVAAPAFAGEKTPLSAVPMLPAVKDAENPPKIYGVPGITLKEQQTQRSSYYEVNAATKQGYCLVNKQAALQLDASTADMDTDEIWHLTEADGKATLERTRYQVAPYLSNVWIKSKASVELKAIATDFGMTVWAMREANGDLVVLAAHATGGRESTHGPEKDATSFIPFSSSSCEFGAARVTGYAIAHGGGAAQLAGALPAVGEGKDKVVPAYVIDVSALKVSRDPEPIVSARIRKIVP